MTSDSTKAAACSVDGLLFDNWFGAPGDRQEVDGESPLRVKV